jgi:hypothetical protein
MEKAVPGIFVFEFHKTPKYFLFKGETNFIIIKNHGKELSFEHYSGLYFEYYRRSFRNPDSFNKTIH